MSVVVAILSVAGLGSCAAVWRGSERAVQPAGRRRRPSRVAGERVMIRSTTGAVITGHLRAGATPATVVLTHGYGGNEEELAAVAESLHRAGVTVFTYDSRGCGGSSGLVTFGVREAEDIVSIVDHLVARGDVDARRIGAFGFSMGGSATLMAAARDARIRAVATDSAWGDVTHWTQDRFLRRPDNRFSTLALLLAERRTRARFRRLRPVELVGHLVGRPVLLVHGVEDDVVPVADAHALAAAVGPSARVWVVAGADHEANVRAGGASASPGLAGFFEQALAADRAA